MAVSKQEVILEFKADTSDVTKSTGKIEKSMENVARSAEDAAEATEEIGKSGKKVGSSLQKAGQLGAKGFKALGTAIKATGVGLLVALVAKLTQKFTENKKVADILEISMAALGVVFNSIIEYATWIIDNLIDAFQNPQEAIEGLKQKLQAVGDYIGTLIETALNPLQRGLLNMKRGFLEAATAAKEFFGGDATELKKQIREVDDQLSDLVKQQEENLEELAQPFEEAAKAVTTYVAKTVEAVKASTALTQSQQALRKEQTGLDVAMAQASAQIEELKRQRDDERLSIEERIAAATKAQELEKQLTDQRVDIANRTLALALQEIELQGETEESLQAVADARIEAANAAAESAALQNEFAASIYALNKQAAEQEAEKAKAAREAAEEIVAAQQELEDELYALTLTAQEREELAAMQEYDRRVAMAGDDEGLIKAATEQLNADLAEIQEKADKEAADKEKANAEAIAAARLSVAKSSLDALSALNQAFAGDSEEQQKKAFERSKKIQTAQALISTYESAVQAFKSLAGIPVVGPGLGAAAAAAAVAAGLANVKQIQSQQYQNAGGGESAASYAGAGSAAQAAQQAPTAPVLDLGFLGAGAGQAAPVQAYVLSENVSNAQQANQKIQDQATL